MFGDSFVYSNRLNKNETFAKILSKNTKRPIYDQSTPYVKPQHILFEFQCDEFYKIIPKPKFIIYLYVPHHIMEVRTKCARSTHDVFYKYNRKRLTRQIRVPFIKKSYFISYINSRLYRANKKFNNLYFNIGKDLYKSIMLESKKRG